MRTLRPASTGCAPRLSVLALFALLALAFTKAIPTVQPGATKPRGGGTSKARAAATAKPRAGATSKPRSKAT